MPTSPSRNRDVSASTTGSSPRFFRKIFRRFGLQRNELTVSPRFYPDDSGLKEYANTNPVLADLPQAQSPGHLRTPRPRRARGADEVARYTASQLPEHGFFSHARHTTIQDSTMIDMSTNYYDYEHIFKSLAEHTMQGAEFDSSARSPPPRCHPGTRKAIMEKTQRWFRDDQRRKKILWLVGPAGVGKSAIMQTLAESASDSSDLKLGATLFFSRPNKRNKPFQVFCTLAYQMAIRHATYREFVLQELATDPRLFDKSIKIQFARLIIEPFGHQQRYQGLGTLLMFLDGLDELEGDRAQCEITELISSFSLTYPTAPLIWVIASRPESHLQAVFTRVDLMGSYDKEEVPADSNEACADVEGYLRKEFSRIQRDNPIARLQSQWPTESQFVKIAAAAGGLFAYASTAISFIDDLSYGKPVSRLDELLVVITRALEPSYKGRTHPLAHLDALYACILSQIPRDILPDTRRLLSNHFHLQQIPIVYEGMVVLCNWVGLTADDAYGALHRLHSVLKVPPPDKVNKDSIEFHHQSFYEYLIDPERSHVFHIGDADIHRGGFECSSRILKEAHSGAVTSAETTYWSSKVSLTWPAREPEALKMTIYLQAKWTFTGLIDEYDPDLVLPTLQDPGVADIMRTLDLQHMRALSIDPVESVDFFYHIQHRLDPRIREVFQRYNLLQEVPISTLHLDNIKRPKEQYTYIRCESDSSVMSDRRLPGRSVGPHQIDYDSKYRYWWCSELTEEHDLQTVLRHLWLAQAQSPDSSVLLFGNVVSAYITCVFTTSDQSECWTYYIPYHLS